MKNIIICIGVSGAGKSSWTKEFIKNNPSYLRSNRDSIREALMPNHQNSWYGRDDRQQLESLVTAIETKIIYSTYYDVVLDNTNCSLKNLKDMVLTLEKYKDVKFKIFPIGVSTAQARVSERDLIMDMERLVYIQRQWDQMQATVAWVRENYNDRIIE